MQIEIKQLVISLYTLWDMQYELQYNMCKYIFLNFTTSFYHFISF